MTPAPMTHDEVERATDGPDVLYLQPGNRGDERCWCEGGMPDANDIQPWNKYIREDLIPVSILAGLAEILRLRDERDQARAALEPFAKAAKCTSPTAPQELVHVEDFRTAARVHAETGKDPDAKAPG